MCQSKSNGGKRCAAHTRPRFEAATFGTPDWDAAAADYARTEEGNTVLWQEMIRTAPIQAEWDKNEACRQALAAAERANAADAVATDLMVQEVADSYEPNLLRGWANSKSPRIVQAVAANESTPADVTRHLAETGTVKVRSAIAKRYLVSDDVYARLARDPNPSVRRAVPPALRQPLGEVPSLAHARTQYEAATYGTDEWDVAAAQYARTDEGYAAILHEKMRTAPNRAEWDKNESCDRALAVAQRYGQVAVWPAEWPPLHPVGDDKAPMREAQIVTPAFAESQRATANTGSAADVASARQALADAQRNWDDYDPNSSVTERDVSVALQDAESALTKAEVLYASTQAGEAEYKAEIGKVHANSTLSTREAVDHEAHLRSILGRGKAYRDRNA